MMINAEQRNQTYNLSCGRSKDLQNYQIIGVGDLE